MAEEKTYEEIYRENLKLKITISTLKENEDYFKGKFEDMEKEILRVSMERTSYKKAIVEKDAEIKSLKSAYSLRVDENGMLGAEIHELRKDFSKLNIQKQDLGFRCNTLTSALKQLEDANNQIRQERDKYKEAYLGLRDKPLESESDKVKSLRNQLSEQALQYLDLSKKYREAQKMLENIKNWLKSYLESEVK